jgi:hypothetical protein
MFTLFFKSQPKKPFIPFVKDHSHIMLRLKASTKKKGKKLLFLCYKLILVVVLF